MTILHISYATTWGGGEQQMIDLIEALNVLEVKNPLVCIKNSMLHNYAIKNNLDVHLIDKRGDLNPIKKALKSNIDIIHIHTGSFIKDFIKLKWFSKIKQPCIYTINGIMRKKSFLSKLKYNFSGINAIHFVSEAARNHFANHVAFKSTLDKLYVIYDGINTSEQKRNFNTHEYSKHIVENDFLVINIANHTRAKNLKSFVEVANEIVNKRGLKTFKFFQVGRKTNLTQELIHLIEKYNLSKHLFLLGFVENAEAYFPSFNALLMTSNREGLPLTIMEAFKYKVPVISSKAGGIPECIISGENGFLSEIDDIESLANHLVDLNQNYKLVSKPIIDKAYSDYLEKYTANIMGYNTLELYKSVLIK